MYKCINIVLTSSREPLSVSRAIFGTMLLLGDRCFSIVPPGLVGGRIRGLSVATLARRPRVVEDAPAGVPCWFEFVKPGDARRRRDEALRCNITMTYFQPYNTYFSPHCSPNTLITSLINIRKNY